MTENAFYPRLPRRRARARARTLERPTLARQVVAARAASARVRDARAGGRARCRRCSRRRSCSRWSDGRLRATLRPFAPLYALRAGGGAARRRSSRLARGRSLADLLGAYRVVGDDELHVGRGRCACSLYHVAELDLYLGVVPFAAALLLLARSRRRLEPPLQALLAARSRSSVWLAARRRRLRVAVSRSRIEERNIFYVAPLFLIALLAWVERGAPRPRVARRRRGGRGARCSPLAIPFERFIDDAARSPTRSCCCRGGTVQDTTCARLDRLERVALVGGALAARSSCSSRARYALAAAASLVLATSRSSFRPIWSGAHGVRAGVGRRALPGDPRRAARLDRRRGAGRAPRSPCSGPGRADRFTVNQNEFFNRSRRRRLLHRRPDARRRCPRRRCAIDPDDGAVAAHGRAPVRARVRCSPTARSPGRRALVADDRSGDALWRSTGRSCRRTSRRRASTRTTPGRARRSPTRGVAAAAATSRSRSSSDASSSRAADGRRRDAAAAARRRRRRPAGRADDARVPLQRGGGLRRALRRSPTAVPARSSGQRRRPRARAPTSTRFDYSRRVRIVFDVSRRCRTRGRASATTSAARSPGSPRPQAERTRSSPSRRRARAGRRGSARRSTGIDVELRLVAAAGLARAADGVEPARPARRPSAARRVRRAALHATGCTRRSAAASARRRSTTSCRCASPSG